MWRTCSAMVHVACRVNALALLHACLATYSTHLPCSSHCGWVHVESRQHCRPKQQQREPLNPPHAPPALRHSGLLLSSHLDHYLDLICRWKLVSPAPRWCHYMIPVHSQAPTTTVRQPLKARRHHAVAPANPNYGRRPLSLLHLQNLGKSC